MKQNEGSGERSKVGNQKKRGKTIRATMEGFVGLRKKENQTTLGLGLHDTAIQNDTTGLSDLLDFLIY